MKTELWQRGLSARLMSSLLALLALSLTIAACGGGGGSASIVGGGGGGGGGDTTALASISISASTSSIVLGQTTTVTAVPIDALGNLLGVSLTWQSSNTAVATINNGVVTGMTQGTTNISVSAGGITSNLISITITAPIGSTPGTDPSVGAHALVFHFSRGSRGATLPLPALTTQSGSTMLAFVGKGALTEINPPTDNLGNTPYRLLGSKHEYTRWPGQGSAAYAFNAIVGGANHVLRVNDQNTFDEVTFAAVEVRNGGVVQDLQFREVLNTAAQTSASVTTTGPATLVAVWFGDDASPTPSNPVPTNGFAVIDGNANSVESVAMFVATKNVSAAGTYNVTWNTTPLQGAQLYLIAVQKAP